MEKQNYEAIIQKVPRKNQMASGRQTRPEGKADGRPRIMFLGNSITLHGPKEDIGWHGDWGMAASSRERDYVHLVEKAVTEKYPDAAFCISQGAEWEQKLPNCDYEKVFGAVKDFAPDVIISSLETNILEKDFDGEVFRTEIRRLHRYLSRPDGATRIIVASSYCHTEKKDIALKAYAEEVGATYVFIGDIRENPENLALDRFEHEGVAGHPGDLGMKRLAERYLKALEGMLLCS